MTGVDESVVHGHDRDVDATLAEMQEELDRLRREVAAWRATYDRASKRDIAFTNSAGEVAPLYSAMDLEGSAGSAFEVPGAYPFTRGIHATGYRGRLWTMRQFAGFGSAKTSFSSRTGPPDFPSHSTSPR
jgi:methylmalonyl-CoA mutase, N-terminal domain